MGISRSVGNRGRRRFLKSFATLGLVTSTFVWTAGTASAEHPVHALINAAIIINPAEQIQKGNVILRDGIVVDAGADAAIPEDARIWDLQGRVVSPGWIDLYIPSARLAKHADAGVAKPGSRGEGTHRDCRHESMREWLETLPSVHPGTEPASRVEVDPDQLSTLRSQGFTTALVVPDQGVFAGFGQLMNLGETGLHEAIVNREAAQCISLEYGKIEDCYPDSIMGAVALVRQILSDVDWYAETHRRWAQGGEGPRPPYLESLESLGSFKDRKGLFVLAGNQPLDLLRQAGLAREFSLPAVLVGTGDEYTILDELSKLGYPVTVPLAFARLTEVQEAQERLDLSLSELRHWDRAPSNPYWLEKAGVIFSISTRDLANFDQFRKMLAIAVKRGLTREGALAALTTTPARILGIADRFGSIEAGKVANLIVSKGDPLAAESDIETVWVDGIPYTVYKGDENAGDDQAGNAGKDRAGKAGTSVRNASGDRKDKQGAGEHGGKGPREEGSADAMLAHPPLDGRGPLLEPGQILVRGATVWTQGPEGRCEGCDLLVDNGTITRVGKDIPAGPDTFVIDARGKHLTPGIIDCHSHAFLMGGVNESTHSSTAEVRISDGIDSRSRNIPLQLAAGVTVSHLLHGSANAIGGQDAVVKLRWGQPPEGLMFEAAPPGIKFALGENVKQSNWGEKFTTRFPQTRMGVEQFVRGRFTEAVEYMNRAKEYENTLPGSGQALKAPPRRILELDTLAEVLSGERLIHCHAYRADEMLMLMRLMEEFGVRIGTFQHILEGYKIADELRIHGAGASCFSDWWAYKFEVYDAIPYNGTLMWERGVLVSFNSDSDELARRLNMEAAKAVKYGGMPEEEALNLVTLNPALQLGVADRVGSLEPGKDADFVLWSDHPFSSFAACEQTWIEGKKYFDKEEERRSRKRILKEREGLLALAEKTPSNGDEPRKKGPRRGEQGQANP